MARPKEFDRNTALQQAMQLFWTKGYEGASMSDLIKAMGISKSSLYETFGDKQQLFLEALNRYFAYTEERKAASFSKSASVKQGMHDFLYGTIRFLLNEKLPGGCFITNTATALGTLDESIQAVILSNLERNETFFDTLLKKGQKNGEIAPDKDIRALARFYVGLVRGMAVIARVSKDRAILEDIVKVGLGALD